jgi:hypothetical protein
MPRCSAGTREGCSQTRIELCGTLLVVSFRRICRRKLTPSAACKSRVISTVSPEHAMGATAATRTGRYADCPPCREVREVLASCTLHQESDQRKVSMVEEVQTRMTAAATCCSHAQIRQRSRWMEVGDQQAEILAEYLLVNNVWDDGRCGDTQCVARLHLRLRLLASERACMDWERHLERALHAKLVPNCTDASAQDMDTGLQTHSLACREQKRRISNHA